MTKKKNSSRNAFISSVLMICLTFTMFVGTTFAWYNDSVTSGRNTIISGSLELELERYTGALGGDEFEDSWAPITGETAVFANDLSFEPGAAYVAYVRVKNAGDLAFKYNLSVKVYSETQGKNQEGVWFTLSDYLMTGSVAGLTKPYPAGDAGRTAAIGAVTNPASFASADLKTNATLQKNTSEIIALVIYLPETTGNETNAQMNFKPNISFGLVAVASQYTVETDSFGNNYDNGAVMPVIPAENAAKQYAADGITLETPHATVTVPAGAEAAGTALTDTDTLKLKVESGNPDSNLQIDDGNGTTTYEVTLTNQDGEKVTSDTGMKVELDIGVVDLQHFYHNATQLTAVNSLADVDALNEYYYDATTGILTFITDSFSPFTAEYILGGGLGTEEYPYLIANVGQWNALYQVAYDQNNNSRAPYVMLANDIDFTGKDILNYATDGDTIVRNHYMSFVLDGDGKRLIGVSSLKGYGQLFPYLNNATIKNITIDYQIEGSNRTIAMCYSTKGNCYFTNVTTTGIIDTTADWGTAFVAYANQSGSNIYYTNCANYANIKASFGLDGYVAPFGSHNGGGVHITFDRCSNYGTIMGNHVGFVGMGNDSAYTFVDSDAVKNYGKLYYTSKGGFFNYDPITETKTIGGVTCNVKQEGAEIFGYTSCTNTFPSTYGDKFFVNTVEGATYYDVEFRFAVQFYNYQSSGCWNGGFPRSTTLHFTKDDAVDGKIDTGIIKAYLAEPTPSKTYGKVSYNGVYNTPYEGIYLNSSDFDAAEWTNLGNGIYIGETSEKAFYYFNMDNSDYYYAGLLTSDVQNNPDTKGLTIYVTSTAYNAAGDVLAQSVNSYSFTASEARAYLGGND